MAKTKKYRNLGGGTVAWVLNYTADTPDDGSFACPCGTDQPGTPTDAQDHAGQCRAF
ncbi:hypothetical protein [Streptosporangium jomthongense]|uniref:Uncharacterized protein n=1 Tax=Streptosporangium jomthongense TaxID=1193683 RepID=A0ABV8EXA9_9ACTN